MKVRTGIKWVAAIMLMVVLCFSVTVAVKGYGMYREAIKEEPIDLRIEKKRSQKDFVGVCQESAISLYRQGIFRFPALLFPRDPEDNPARGVLIKADSWRCCWCCF